MSLISLSQVSFGYDGRETLREVNAEIAPGSFHFLTGPSGAGKTTLLKLLYLEHQPRAGRIEFFGEDPSRLRRPDRLTLRRRIGIVFQDFRLLDHLSVADNVRLPLVVHGRDPALHAEDVTELLRWVGLTHRAEARPRALSAGEQQRAAIARAVITSPDVILADEPTGNVDAEMGMRILRLFVELNRLGKTVLIATHDLGLIRSARKLASTRILRLADGQLTVGGAEL
ncbi:MAG: ATP-binding cassette domain-containing protein [Pseudomonadota bacterium]